MDYYGEFPDSPLEPASSQSTSAPTTSRKRKHQGSCDICGAVSDGAHFGAEACRACTAFFRRSVANNRKYRCHNGILCEELSRDRRTCRACRWKRCIEAGMEKAAVQRYEAGTDTTEEWVECPSVDRMPILTKMAQHYDEVKRIRNILHGEKNTFPKALDCVEAATIHLNDAGLIAEFLSKSFEETNKLEEDQRKLMFKMFPRQFILLEGVYRASLKDISAMIIPNGDMIDFEHPDTFFPTMTGSDMISQVEAVRLFYPILDLYKRCILEPVNQLKIDEMEFLFLCGTMFWDCSYEHQSTECETVARSIKARLVQEIVFYLRRKRGIKEPAVRMSSLMMILTVLERVVYKMQQDIGMSHAFNVYKMDEKFYKYVNCNF